MNYSIEILEKEKYLLNACLSNWHLSHYPEVRKNRQKRLDDLDLCINVLKCVNNGVNPFEELSSQLHGIDKKN